MTDTHAFYAPGNWTLLARDGRYLLVDATPADQPISLLWAALESTADPADVLDALANELPDAGFCLIRVDDNGVQIAQHEIVAALDGTPIDAGATPSTVLLPASGGTIVAAPTPSAADLQIPIEGGVVGAGALIVVQVGAEVVPEPDVQPAPDVAANTQIWADVPEFVQAASLGGSAPVIGETVLAGICLNGHYSGANAPACRICGSPMPPQTPRTIARPSLGSLVLQDGTTIDLDRGAILGRAPRVPEDATERPHLVNLAAYGRDVSRQHAEVIVHGWSVFVRDLDSSNGTRVHDPIGRIITLQSGVSVPLLPGGLIDIAEVTTIQYRTSP